VPAHAVLASLLGARAVGLPVPTPDPGAAGERARRTAEEVLARPEYAALRPSLLERLYDWLNEQIGRLLERLAHSPRASLIGSVVIILLVVVVGVLVWRFARGLRRDPRSGRVAVGTNRRGADHWRGEAVAAEQTGRWREALRCRYRELLAEAAAAGVVEELAGRTTGEYLAAVRANLPAAAQAFGAVTRGFELAWYGRAPVGRDDLEAVRRQATVVRGLLPRARVAVEGGDAAGVVTSVR
jgi:hypothetical protein